MMNEKKIMKILKWENNKGLFLRNENFIEIEKINTEDISNLFSLILNEEFFIEEYPKENIEKLQNSPNFLIYRDIYDKFLNLKENKKEILEEIEEDIKKLENNLN